MPSGRIIRVGVRRKRKTRWRKSTNSPHRRKRKSRWRKSTNWVHRRKRSHGASDFNAPASEWENMTFKEQTPRPKAIPTPEEITPQTKKKNSPLRAIAIAIAIQDVISSPKIIHRTTATAEIRPHPVCWMGSASDPTRNGPRSQYQQDYSRISS
jgi:hypothetical protein